MFWLTDQQGLLLASRIAKLGEMCSKTRTTAMATWRCVKQCGACCHLDPAERPDLAEYLSPADLELYLSLVGPDGWCIHFDADTRECRIYDDRPRFCRVEPDVFWDLYGVELPDLNDFAIDCCRQQIEGVYGHRSLELLRFNRDIGLEIERP